MTVLLTVVIGATFFLSSMIQGAIGIGFAMLASAVFAFFLPPANSSALIGYAAVIAGISLSLRMRAYIRMRIALPPLIAMMITRVLGVVTLMHMDAGLANRVLGAGLLLFALYFWLFGERVRIRPTAWKGFLLGLFAGYLGGLYGLTGPFCAVYFFSALDSGPEYVASMNFAFLPSAFLGLGMHLWYGNITASMLPACLLSVPAVIFGAALGVRVLRGMDRAQLSRAIYLFMACMGVVLLAI